jgi:pimeloyl-ACP methyl ester carboxylesterase/RimJ/RimL family protein N-acetyltransferase
VEVFYETDRCIVRNWRPGDAERVFDIYRRWEVSKWLGPDPKPMESLEAAERLVQRWGELNTTQPETGRWAVERKDDGVVAGTIILLPLPDGDGEFEVGWHFHPDAWGQGLASESARGAIEWGFAHGHDEILAVVRPGNGASIALCNRLGMTPMGRTKKYYQAELELFRITPVRTDLAVRRSGRPHNEAPTLVFLHGLTDSGSGWPGAVEHWGSDYAIVSFDARGHGESPRFTREQLDAHPGDVMVADAIAVLEQLGEPPVLVGHSLGGAVALTVAVQRPDLVRAIVLEDPAPLGPDEQQQDPVRGKDFLAGVLESIAAGDSLMDLRRGLHPDWADDELLVSGRAEQQMDTDYLDRGEFKPSTPWPELFQELLVPALVVTGDAAEGICVDHEMEDGIAAIGNPNVSVVRLAGAGHCVRREQPDKFYAVVDEWLVRH